METLVRGRGNKMNITNAVKCLNYLHASDGTRTRYSEDKLNCFPAIAFEIVSSMARALGL